MPFWLLLALVAMTLWGISGVAQKLASNHLSTKNSISVFTVTMIPLALLLVPFFPVDFQVGLKVIVLGVFGGLAFTLGQYSVFLAFECGGKASIVVPIVSMFPLITAMGAHLILGEQVSRVHALAILLAPVAAWLLSVGES